MIRVLHLLPKVNAMCGDFGVVMNYYRHIDRSQVQFDFGYITDTEGDNRNEIEDLGGKTFKLKCPSVFGGAKSFIASLKSVLAGNNYHIIHLHMPTFHRFVKKAIKGLDIKLIVHAHSTRFSDSKIKEVRNRLLIAGVSNNVDCRMACSVMAGEKWFGKTFLKSEHDICMKNAINLNRFGFNSNVRAKVRSELGLEDEIAVCHIGRFSKEKNHEYLIKIFHEMSKQEPRVKLYLIGVGDLMQPIQQMVDSMGLNDKVVFMGLRKDVNELLQAMDIFLLPSHFEGLCLALVEAQASGLICFASSNCTIESKITNNLYFIDLNQNESFWARTILEKHKGFVRKDVSEQVEKNGYSIQCEAIRLLNIYKEVCHG